MSGNSKKHSCICRLCGKDGPLTFEHVPPKSAFNDEKARLVNTYDYLKSNWQSRPPWDLYSAKSFEQQNGKGGYYLCQSCNNITGKQYIPFYKDFATGIHGVLSSQYQDFKEMLADKQVGMSGPIRPLAVFKQIMVMFCDINNDCFRDEELRSFLLDRDSKTFNSNKYKVYAHVFGGGLRMQNPLSYVLLDDNRGFFISSIIEYPISYTLYIDKPDSYNPDGTDITCFSKYSYNDTATMYAIFPVHECNNFLCSFDYRSKEEFKLTLDKQCGC